MNYQNQRLIFATEGFGARLAPLLVRYCHVQNDRIEKHEIPGIKINFSSIMINKYVLCSLVTMLEVN